MLLYGLFSGCLHTRVNSSVYLQSIGIDVIFRPIGFGVVLDPFLHKIAQMFAEIGSNTLIVPFRVEIQAQRKFLQGVFFLGSEVVVFLHLCQYYISTIDNPLRIATRVIERRVLEHTYQYCPFFYFEVFRFFPKIDTRGRTNPIGIIIKVVFVKIHGKDFLFGILSF